MKKILIFVFILLVLPTSVFAEEISNFFVDIKVNQDSSIIVEETIMYDFGDLQRHGIYRDIQYKYKAGGGNYKLDIKVLSVSDGEKDLKYTTSRRSGYFKIKIGDADKYVTGGNKYVITYSVKGAINYFDDYDELYWNSTGNEWGISIGSSVTQIELPSQIDKDDKQVNCFTGYQGGSASDCIIFEQNGKTVFKGEGFLSKQGMTVLLGWPKGIVHEPTIIERTIQVIRDNLIVLVPIIVFIFLFTYWRRHGRDPKGRGTIMPEYGPPENILPAEAGVVIDEKMDMRDLSATIIDLARRGYLKIKQEDKKALGLNVGKNWSLLWTEKSIQDLSAYERKLIEAFFSNDTKKEMALNKIKRNSKITNQIKEIKKSVYVKVTKDGWFTKNPETTRATLTIIGGAIIFGFFFFGGFNSSGLIPIISILITGALIMLFAQIMPKKTQKGTVMKERLEGFKMFLSATEKDRVKFHFSPSANPEKFADYLPWAIIFGVEKEWAGVFQGIDLAQPDWYVGPWATHYMAMSLANSMGLFNSSFSKGMTAANAGAAKGVSGFSGGGFSGGGFGGGGGGSW